MNLLLRGGHVIDPVQGLDGRLDVRIRDGRIAEIGEHLEPAGAELFEAQGTFVAPGFIDIHVHLREPGQTSKETIASGAAAAAAGGFTAVACMPNTQPALDNPDVIEEVRRRAARAGLARVYPIAAITLGRAGTEPVSYRALRAAGAVAFSDDGAWVADPGVLYHAALGALDTGGTFISHCEDEQLKGDAVANLGSQPLKLGLACAPSLCEDIVVARDAVICGATGKAFHIAHLSTATSAALVRDAKARGWPITCEVTPHHVLLCDDDVRAFDGSFIVNPPLRSRADMLALREAVRDGTIDAFATDHAPHTSAEKARLAADAPPGFSGLEIALGAYHAAIPDLPLKRFVELLSVNPARIAGVEGGSLRPGTRADVTLFADRPWRVDASAFHSMGKNTPFDGAAFGRRAVATIVGGNVIMREGRLTPAVTA